jgi:hypothetical protein
MTKFRASNLHLPIETGRWNNIPREERICHLCKETIGETGLSQMKLTSMTSLNIPSGKESEDLPYLYWIPKLHKTPYKERYIAGSSTSSDSLPEGMFKEVMEVSFIWLRPVCSKMA